MKLSNFIPGLRTHQGHRPSRSTSSYSCDARSWHACCGRASSTRNGVEIAGRIPELVPKVEPEKVASLAIEARTKMKLRHAPLSLVREMARHASYRKLVAETLEQVIQRADELAEFVALY